MNWLAKNLLLLNTFSLVLKSTNAIVKTGILENTVRRIGTIVGRTLAITEGLVLIKWRTLIVLVNLDFEVGYKVV